MNFSMNLHAAERWIDIRSELFGQNDGCAVLLYFRDNEEEEPHIAIHFGVMENANEFVCMLKKAINSLPEYCETCGKKKE